jgi:LAO/AO transport system kinase
MEPEKLNEWFEKRRLRKDSLKAQSLFEKLIQGDKMALSSALTLVESSRKEDRKEAQELISLALSQPVNSVRIGITGVPGVGKSTFIESFGKSLVKRGKKVAVLAIDPSSAVSGGSILGDKTRMPELSSQENAFIRPSPAGKTLGGVASRTRESVYLCEAAGFDIILIETVGVGQSETYVHSMVDFFLLLMLSGAGDELQGMKRGIMEMADLLLVTKADGDNAFKAEAAARMYANALHLFPAKRSGWIAGAKACSALTGVNIQAIWIEIEKFLRLTIANEWLLKHRKEQDRDWMIEHLRSLLLADFFEVDEWKNMLFRMERKVYDNEITPMQAAKELYESFKNQK